MKKKKHLFLIWAGIVASIAFGWEVISYVENMSASKQASPATPVVDQRLALWNEVLAHTVAPPLGNTDGRYALVEFGDFQCPLCGKMEPKVYRFVINNQTRLCFYFVQLPLDVHPLSRVSAEAAQTAAAHGKFWPMYRLLYANQSRLSRNYLAGYAARAGVDPAVFQAEMNEGKYMPEVMDARDFSDAIQIPATPTFLLRDQKEGTVKMIVGDDILKTINDPNWPAVLAAPTPVAASSQPR